MVKWTGWHSCGRLGRLADNSLIATGGCGSEQTLGQNSYSGTEGWWVYQAWDEEEISNACRIETNSSIQIKCWKFKYEAMNNLATPEPTAVAYIQAEQEKQVRKVKADQWVEERRWHRFSAFSALVFIQQFTTNSKNEDVRHQHIYKKRKLYSHHRLLKKKAN